MQSCVPKISLARASADLGAWPAAAALDIWSPLTAGGDAPTDGRDGQTGSIPVKVEPVAASPQPPAVDRIEWISIGAALLTHCAILVALALAGPPEPSGGGGQWLEAIGVDIVITPVMEAREAKATETAAAASATVAPDDGDPSKAEAALAEPAKPDRATEAREQPTEVALAEAVPLPRPEPDPAAVTTPEETKQEAARPPSPEAQSHGGVAALAVEGTTPTIARASASAGAVQRYAMQVRAALARHKPDGHGIRGTATIAFGISPAGKVTFSRVTNSSGHPALDKAALTAVLHTEFPPPPEGMTETQLSYMIPFHFK